MSDVTPISPLGTGLSKLRAANGTRYDLAIILWEEANAINAELAALRAENKRARKIITDYELDYDAVVVRREKCAMDIAIEERDQLRAENERLKSECDNQRDLAEFTKRGYDLLKAGHPPVDRRLLDLTQSMLQQRDEENEKLRNLAEQLAGALKPFAEYANGREQLPDRWRVGHCDSASDNSAAYAPTLGDIRCAAIALAAADAILKTKKVPS